MFSAVLGLFSHDLAIDLGSTTTRVMQRGGECLVSEPTVVAVRTDRKGRRAVVAIGEDARAMLGRAPDDTQVVQPIRGGRIVDFEAVEAFLLALVRRSHGRNGWVRPRMVVAVPHGAAEMEMRAVRDACESAGARDVHLVPRPLAAALGAELPIHQPSGYLVVDLGGGATEASVLSLSGVVAGQSVPGGGAEMDEAVVQWLAQHHGLLVGPQTAERLKIQLGAAVPDVDGEAVVKGRCLALGIPRAATVPSLEIYRALVPALDRLADIIRGTLERLPPEIGSDVIDHGVVLTGGGARLRGIEVALRDRTGLPVVACDLPDAAVARGAARLLDTLDLSRRLAS